MAVPDASFSDISHSLYTVRLFHFRTTGKILVRMYDRSEKNIMGLNQFDGNLMVYCHHMGIFGVGFGLDLTCQKRQTLVVTNHF